MPILRVAFLGWLSVVCRSYSSPASADIGYRISRGSTWRVIRQPSSVSRQALRITFFNSLMLPGHSYCRNSCSVSASIPITILCNSILVSCIKCSIKMFRSSFRSLSGGIAISNSFNLWNRSSRNLPAFTARARSSFDAAMTRTSTGISSVPPTLRILRSCKARSR
ncbi:hypothetical protein D3C86_1573120 [compost metagenome]